MPSLIDLRSDTVTLPSDDMRKEIAVADVGDDQFGEDPSVNLLQERIASLLNKESALWLPTGTMANQVALKVFTQPGDDVIVSRESHSVWHETGGSAANSGVQFTAIGSRGVFTPDEFRTAIKPRSHIIYPPTTLVQIENTHNRAGGIIFPKDYAEQICSIAKDSGIASYLDGARLWNASVSSGIPPDVLSAPFDLVSVSLSKGLGAPGGAVLAGTQDIIRRCVRYRRMFGGAMRQAGIFASAGIFAIDKNMKRLSEDHANAKLFAKILSENNKIVIDLNYVQTNIIIFSLTEDAPDAQTVVSRAKEKGLLIFAFGPRTIRAVTHLDVSESQCRQAAEIILDIISV